tara:strand:- start:1048 stop:1908 length:861 start_codon:yes stop_codon:yes gene_type:complete
MLRNIIKSNYKYSRVYNGNLKAVILDWSGTTVDKYVIAPTEIFYKIFNKYDIPITMEDARGPMGLRKDLHIREILKKPEVKKKWIKKYGLEPSNNDIEKMTNDFIKMQLSTLDNYSKLLPNTSEVVTTLRNLYGLKFGCTTGFNKDMVDILLKSSEKQGYIPDSSVAGDEVQNGGRPKPFMLYRNLELLDVHPIQSVLKVDDTVCGIEEGLEAGCWTVGLSKYSNYMNINNLDTVTELDNEEYEFKLSKSQDTLLKSGAHYVIDGIESLPEVVSEINERLRNGEKP